MANASDRFPPLPYVPALDPAEFEQTWQDAPRLLAALNAARLGAWSWDIDSGKVSWSRGAQALFGLDPKRPVRIPVHYIEMIPEEDRKAVMRSFQAVLDGEPETRLLRHRIRWPDGSLHWLEVSGCLQQDDQGRPMMIGVVREITEQQEREQELASSEKRFTSLFRLSPDVVLLERFDNGVITEANQHFESLLGWPAADVLGRSSIELGLWVDVRQRDQLRRQARNSREPVVQEVQLRTRDGRVLDGLLSSQYLELDEQAFLLSSFLDASERKRAEAALRASEEKFAKAFRNSPDTIVITEKATGRFVELNPGFQHQFGWSAEEAVGRTSLELGLWANAGDRQRMLDALQRDGTLKPLEGQREKR